MFNADAMDAVRARQVDPLDGLDLKGLLGLRQRIDERLPPRSIEEMNMEEEAILQFHLAKKLMNDTIASEAPANQKAQTMNTCAAILNALASTQTALYNAERVKMLEQCLERAFVGVATHVKQSFYDRYKAAVDAAIALKDARKA